MEVAIRSKVSLTTVTKWDNGGTVRDLHREAIELAVSHYGYPRLIDEQKDEQSARAS